MLPIYAYHKTTNVTHSSPFTDNLITDGGEVNVINKPISQWYFCVRFEVPTVVPMKRIIFSLLKYFLWFLFNLDDASSSFLLKIGKLERGSARYITEDSIPRCTFCFLGDKNRHLIILCWTLSPVPNKWMGLPSFHYIYGCNMYLEPRTYVMHVGARRYVYQFSVLGYIFRNIRRMLFYISHLLIAICGERGGNVAECKRIYLP